MELASLPLLGFLVSLIFFLLVRKVVKINDSSAPRKRLPPGPWELPLLGSLHHVLLSPYRDLPHRALRELSGRHGPVMLLHIGVVPTLVVSSPEAAREVLKTHDISFASRHLSPTLDLFSSGGQGIVFAPYGDLWRQLRRVCILELFSTRIVQSFRHIREDEAAGLLSSIADECARSGNGAVVEIGERMSHMTNDIVVRSFVGSRCLRHHEFLRMMEESVKLAAGFNLADLFPSSTLARWLSGGLRKAERCNQQVYDILKDIILERTSTAAGAGGSESEDDLLGVLLRVQRDGAALPTEIINTVILELFGAGSETSARTLEWALSELVRQPHLLHKAQAEVREAFKGQHKITEEDVRKLSYLHLVIKETLRMHAPVPFLLPRVCKEQCEVMGYDIPEGTNVLVNTWAMSRDGAYWEDAEEFKPERFETSTAVDFKGRDFEFIPFGSGRRICPGMGLGLANMELVLASLLYHFDWELPHGDGELDMSESFGITIGRKSKLVLRATQRIPFAN